MFLRSYCCNSSNSWERRAKEEVDEGTEEGVWESLHHSMMNFRCVGSDGKEGRPPGGGLIPSTPAQAGLARQSSVYSLTLDEFQSTLGGLGKDFGSMNMDELLKNIWTAEESQAMAAAALAAAGAMADCGAAGSSGAVGLQRQGSLSLPRTLSQKTVDEVWRDLFKEGGGGGGGGQGPAGRGLHQQPRQPTLGEMTLEEFLVRAGVVREDLTAPAPRHIVTTANTGTNSSGANYGSNVLYGDVSTSQLNSNPGLPMGFPLAGRGGGGTVAPHPVPDSSSATALMMSVSSERPPVQLGNAAELASLRGVRIGGGVMGIGDPSVNGGLMPGMVGLGGVTVAAGSPANHLPSDELGKVNGELPSLSPVPYVFNGGLRGRKCSGALEKVVERRQKRMIKNRESAARSRARKQAYTMELEAEVAKLKEQNQALQKKQEEIKKTQKNQVLEMINKQRGPKKRCLRRTQTGP